MTRRLAIDIAMDARNAGDASSLMAVAPLPDGVKDLLRIVAEGEWRAASTEHIYARYKAPEVRAASAAFLAVVLFDRKADPYRTLGLVAGAAPSEVRENKRLLLKWLHPDRNPDPRERTYLARVIEAAKAIEEGRVHPGSKGTPKVPVNTRLEIPMKRPQESAFRYLVIRIAGGALHLGSVVVVAVSTTFLFLVLWRYVIGEPIGSSLERYSKAAAEILTW